MYWILISINNTPIHTHKVCKTEIMADFVDIFVLITSSNFYL